MRKLANSELNRLSREEFKFSPKLPVAVVLDNVRSLHNVGSVFRTADAFGVEILYLCGITGSPPHREIEKTALGATLSVNWKYSGTTIETLALLKKEGYVIISVEQVDKSIKLDCFTPERGRKYALVFGHEVSGVSQAAVAFSDACIEIPQSGTKHSLNIAVCAGIVLWEFASALGG